MSQLTTTARAALPASDFGDPAARTYPVVDASDVGDAAALLGKAPAADRPAIKARLIAIAHRKGFALPAAWQEAEDAAKATPGGPLNLFIPITKIDARLRQVWGIAAEEQPDRVGEVFDYTTSVPHFQAWSTEFAKLTDGKSVGNVRAMHGPVAAGKLVSITYDDVTRKIPVGAEIVDDQEWAKVEKGVYTGFSIGGKYGDRWDGPDGRRHYTALPAEISLVDHPCMPGATFQVVKADGEVEMRKFAMDGMTERTPDPAAEALEEVVEEAQAAAVGEPVAPDDVVSVARDTLQRLHTLVCALGASCAVGWKPYSPEALVLSDLHAALCAMGASCGEMGKADPAADLAKAGARHSQADQEHVQAMHNHSVALGAACDDADAEKGTPVEDLAKGEPAADLVITPIPAGPIAVHVSETNPLVVPPAEPDGLAKLTTQFTDALQTIAALQTRLAKLEAEPSPGGPMLTSQAAQAAQKMLGAGGPAPDAHPLVTEGNVLAKLLAAETNPAARAGYEHRLQLLTIHAAQGTVPTL